MSEHPPELSPDQLREMLYTMYRIRAFEEKVDELFMSGQMHGTTHLSIGQEGAAVGAMRALRDDDYITSTHRGHGHFIAKGADISLMIAELLGKETGYCRGRGGSMHIADVEMGHLYASKMIMRPERETKEHRDPCLGQTDCQYGEGPLQESELRPENAAPHPRAAAQTCCGD